jgi:hypothetical protein
MIIGCVIVPSRSPCSPLLLPTFLYQFHKQAVDI